MVRAEMTRCHEVVRFIAVNRAKGDTTRTSMARRSGLAVSGGLFHVGRYRELPVPKRRRSTHSRNTSTDDPSVSSGRAPTANCFPRPCRGQRRVSARIRVPIAEMKNGPLRRFNRACPLFAQQQFRRSRRRGRGNEIPMLRTLHAPLSPAWSDGRRLPADCLADPSPLSATNADRF